jgi:hypothetical protein
MDKRVDSLEFFSRANRGRDIGAQRDFLSVLKSARLQPQSVTFINSSMAWSPKGLRKLITGISKSRSVYFPIVSYQPVVHYQSYFIFIPSCYLQSVTSVYMDQFRNWRFKRSVVCLGEKKLAKLFDEKAIETATVISELDANKLGMNFDFKANPSLKFGEAIYNSGKFPGLKRILLSQRPFIIQ